MKNYIIVDGEGNTSANSRPYNLGYVIFNEKGEILSKGSYVFPKWFKENQDSFYFKQNLADFELHPKNYIFVNKAEDFDLPQLIKKYNARVFLAWNCKTDWNFFLNIFSIDAQIAVAEWFERPYEISEGFWRNNSIEELQKYNEFCKENDFLTSTGNLSAKVNHIMKYYKGTDYEEKHEGGSDVLDELYILKKMENGFLNYETWTKNSANYCGRNIMKKLGI